MTNRLRTIAFCLALTGTLTGRCDRMDALRSVHELDAFLRSGLYEVRDFAFRGRVCQGNAPNRKSFFLDDGTNIICLVDNALWSQTLLRAGDIVEVRGQTSLLSSRHVNADCLAIVRTGHEPLPAPPERSIRDLRNDRGHPLFAVRVRGTVRDVFRDEIDHEYINLVLAEDGASLCLSFSHSDELWTKLNSLVGAEIAADGIIRTDEGLGSDNNSSWGDRETQEPTLTVAGTESIRVLRPAPDDPFAVPSLDELILTWPDDLITASRHRIEGIVLSAARPRGFLLRTGTGRLVNVDLADGSPPCVGTSVVAAGIPVTDFFRVNLMRAIWKRTNRPDVAVRDSPERTTVAALLTDGLGHAQYKTSLFGRRVRLAGRVRGLPAPGGSESRIILESDGLLLSAVAEPGVTPFSDVMLDAEIEVTGLCLMDIESWQPGMSFPRITDVRVAVQSPDDVGILSRPSWWTAKRLLALVCLLALAASAIVIWNLALRTLVIRKSRELLREQTRRLSETLRVEERTRLATELHDTVAQNLSGLSLQLDAAGRLADSDPVSMKPVLAFASKTLLACRRELRDCLWDLRSQALDEKDMNAAIRRALSPHLGSAQLVVRFNVPRRKLSDNTVHAVLRILGELSANAIRHGRAKTLRIAGSLDDEGLRFSCTDDGCGFDATRAPGPTAGRFGLQGVRDRVRAFNGSFNLTSAPDKGTRAVVHLHPAQIES